MLHLHHPESEIMNREHALRSAFDAAFQTGERMREMNSRLEWTDEEIDAAATELRRRLLGEHKECPT
jgi:hypothetical protein